MLRRSGATANGSGTRRPETPSTIFEFGGPCVYSYQQLLRAVGHRAGAAPLLIPIPFAFWHALAMALREAAEPAPHAESSGTDADRHRVIAGDAWICRTWNYAAVSRGQTPDAASVLLLT